MREAFEGRELTEEEKSALVAFLQAADEEHETQQARDYGNTLLTSGLIWIVFVLGFFALLGIRGTKRTVNQQIYERQLKST